MRSDGTVTGRDSRCRCNCNRSMQILPFKRDKRDISQYNEETLKKITDIIKQKNPLIFFLVMQKKMSQIFDWMDIFKEICYADYKVSLKILNSRKITGFPVMEEQLYVIGSRISDY